MNPVKPLILLLTVIAASLSAQTAKPYQLPAGIRMEKDITYIEGGDEAQRLDIYLPETPPLKPLPLIDLPRHQLLRHLCIGDHAQHGVIALL